jgi:hypothetical protein
MWKLYRGLNAASTDEETKDDGGVESTNTEPQSETKTKRKRSNPVSTENDTHSIEIEEKGSKRLQGKSIPKIYV